MVFKSEQQSLSGVKPPLKKLEKKEKLGDGRKTIAVLFIITVLASSLFYLQTELPKIWEKITAPQVISNLPVKRFDPNPVLEKIKDLTKNLSGTYGVYVYRFANGNNYGINQERAFPAASLNKLPLMIAIYQEAERGKIDLETKYILQEKDKVSGAGILQSKPAGTSYAYRQLIEYMAQYSDNTAFKIMRRIIGDETINKTIANLGMKKTSLAKNETTPQDIGILFKKLYQEKRINNEHQDELLKYLTKTGFEDRIPKGIPEDIRVAHKIGTEIGVFSDAGIIFAEKPFVLVIMSKSARESEALEAIPKITQAVWEFETDSF